MLVIKSEAASKGVALFFDVFEFTIEVMYLESNNSLCESKWTPDIGGILAFCRYINIYLQVCRIVSRLIQPYATTVLISSYAKFPQNSSNKLSSDILKSIFFAQHTFSNSFCVQNR